ncbi:L-histidine N(alpha)-methyltransferase [Leeuwenhoekiella sp. W20_SRS_FM14]|uniref:L-histidine N(alpha)-methyltransferase n=1 Tax=Leeuwenhoekiella sp. W20_SRS_FM14 TaxID=3240270 RepID=UPI003F9C2E73
MNTNQNVTFKNTFEEEVYEGLTAFPKYLSSKWFYDMKGDKLFQKIMALPEYYLTECERSIIEENKADIAQLFSDNTGFDLVELGAGDGKKTKILLQELVNSKLNFTYRPIDISQNVLDELEEDVLKRWPKLDIITEQGTYFNILNKLSEQQKDRKMVIVVLGSNIGNLSHQYAVEFLTTIRKSMQPDDLLFMGFDQKKNPEVILKAYNDSQGVTESFNKNLLTRINKEMDANFEIDNFKHWPVYDPESGTTKSFLVSTKDQTVTIQKLNLDIHFSAWESIHTEISQKYDDDIVNWLAQEAGLSVEKQYTDHQNYFTDYIFRIKN